MLVRYSRFSFLHFFPFVAHHLKSVRHTLFELHQWCDAQLLLDCRELLLLVLQLIVQPLNLILKLYELTIIATESKYDHKRSVQKYCCNNSESVWSYKKGLKQSGQCIETTVPGIYMF